MFTAFDSVYKKYASPFPTDHEHNQPNFLEDHKHQMLNKKTGILNRIQPEESKFYKQMRKFENERIGTFYCISTTIVLTIICISFNLNYFTNYKLEMHNALQTKIISPMIYGPEHSIKKLKYENIESFDGAFSY